MTGIARSDRAVRRSAVHGGGPQGREGEALRIGFVGTYPPTRCGIATFTASLRTAISALPQTGACGVVASVGEHERAPHSSHVVASLIAGSSRSREAAATALDEFDTVVVQHEFGIYGGADGEEVIELVRRLSAPVIVVLHTVPASPTPTQRRIVETLGALAGRLVVQSGVARDRLLSRYAIERAKVRTIPHGAHPNPPRAVRRRESTPPVVLTWGLLGPDKGVELGIEALARLADLVPAPRYVVAGQTHPKVRQLSGERYRDSLIARAAQLGVADRVVFEDGYADASTLLQRVREADVVLLPYRSREQVVSGVLVEALASGKPVVATRFPHAVELLGAGSGLLVAYDDPAAIASALRRLLTDRALAESAADVARRQAKTFFWSTVAESYLEVAREVARPRRAAGGRVAAPSFEHLLRLADGVGVYEHARLTLPRRDHGYCTDDVARALLAVVREPARAPRLERLAETCLRFLERAQLPDGRFRNRLSAQRRWLDSGSSDDATGRALWAAGSVVALSCGDRRERSLRLFERGSAFRSSWPRANAFAVLGAAELLTVRRDASAAGALLRRAAGRLGCISRDGDWPWPEPRLGYANAVLAEARIAAGVALADDRLLAEGLALLAWLVSVETRGDHFSFTPAGGWGPGEPRPAFDQQPLEAAAMAEACTRAFEATGDPEWAATARRACDWFFGANDLGLALADRQSGGCRDGLERDGVNENQGAESTLALISALQLARRVQAAAPSASSSRSVSTTAAPTQRSAAP